MRRNHNTVWVYYGFILLVFGLLIYSVALSGKSLEIPRIANGLDKSKLVETNGLKSFLSIALKNIDSFSSMFLLQMITILIFARFMGFIFSKMGQPTVIGEILAGILLGPSVLGHFSPDSYKFLFPDDSLANIYILSQIGLILFMFVIGMELNISALKGKFSQTFVISQSGIIIPFALGMLLAHYIYKEFASGMTGFLPFALFIGIAMSITAFPVLARILQEKDLTRTNLGSMSLGIAAIGDVTAWCLLAVVIAISSTGSLGGSVYTILISIAYVFVMFFIIKPFLKKLGDVYKTDELVNKSMVAFIFLIMLLSAYTTQIIGIHALFGAFMAGVVMPSLSSFRKIIADKIEDVSVTLFLPLFFVFTGLRTEFGLLDSSHLWIICGWFFIVAVVGKFCGTAIPAKILGENWHDSLSMGVLMNTRGLMELIVINIGYEMGILPPVIFVMLVIMALLTTFVTTPTMSLIERLFPNKGKQEELLHRQTLGIFNALVALGNPENGKPLLNVAKAVLDGYKNSLSVTVLHITAGTDINPILGEQLAEESFKAVRAEADLLGIPIQTDYKITDNISKEIVSTTNIENYDFLLVGAGISMNRPPFRKKGKFGKIPVLRKLFSTKVNTSVFYPGSLIKDKTRYFIENSKCSVGVFINLNFNAISKTLILLESEEDSFLLRYARRLIRNNRQINVRIMASDDLYTSSEIVAQGILALMNEFPDNVKMCKDTLQSQEYMKKFSFMLISFQTWTRLSSQKENELAYIPSTLIINKKPSRFHSQSQENSDDE